MTTISPTVIAPGAASIAMLGGFGIDWKIDGAVSSGRFSVVHHPLALKALGAPLHRHHDHSPRECQGRAGTSCAAGAAWTEALAAHCVCLCN